MMPSFDLTHIKIIHYNFTPEEVQAMYRLIMYMGWIPRNDDEIDKLVHRIMEIQKANDLATRDNQTT